MTNKVATKVLVNLKQRTSEPVLEIVVVFSDGTRVQGTLRPSMVAYWMNAEQRGSYINATYELIKREITRDGEFERVCQFIEDLETSHNIQWEWLAGFHSTNCDYVGRKVLGVIREREAELSRRFLDERRRYLDEYEESIKD